VHEDLVTQAGHVPAGSLRLHYQNGLLDAGESFGMSAHIQEGSAPLEQDVRDIRTSRPPLCAEQLDGPLARAQRADGFPRVAQPSRPKEEGAGAVDQKATL
jgi:hypothetical protein